MNYTKSLSYGVCIFLLHAIFYDSCGFNDENLLVVYKKLINKKMYFQISCLLGSAVKQCMVNYKAYNLCEISPKRAKTFVFCSWLCKI